MFYKKLAALFFTVGVLLLTGCHSPVYNQTEANVADVKLRAEAARQASNDSAKPLSPLLINQGLYVDRTPISLYRQPLWLKNQIILRGDQLPFSYYSRTIAGGGGRKILTRYQTELDPVLPISVNYTGTVKGALDLLAAKTGYLYTIRGNNVYWQAYVTKTFDIAFMPGSQDYLMGKSEGVKSSVNASNSGGSSVNVTGFIDDSAASQYSSFKGKLSLWEDLRNTIQQMLSKDGRVLVSEATTTVTVRDKPSNVALVSQYIKNLNCNLAKQVLVKVQVLEVQLNTNFSWGINWNVLQNAFGHGNYVLNANYGTPISITPITVASIPTGGLAADAAALAANANGASVSVIQALVNALSEQGKVSVVSEPRVVCLNNQVSVIRIVTQKGYLASLQTTNFGGGTSNSTAGTSSTSVTTQITPGTMVFGITLYVLPKILGNKVFMQVNADLSNFVSLVNVSSTGSASTAANPSNIIQVPTMTQKQFNQRSMLHSGETLILSGFRQLQNQANASQLVNSQDLGGKGASQSNSETIVLLTPIILHGRA